MLGRSPASVTLCCLKQAPFALTLVQACCYRRCHTGNMYSLVHAGFCHHCALLLSLVKYVWPVYGCAPVLVYCSYLALCVVCALLSRRMYGHTQALSCCESCVFVIFLVWGGGATLQPFCHSHGGFLPFLCHSGHPWWARFCLGEGGTAFKHRFVALYQFRASFSWAAFLHLRTIDSVDALTSLVMGALHLGAN